VWHSRREGENGATANEEEDEGDAREKQDGGQER